LSRKQKAKSKKQKAIVAEIRADLFQHRILSIPLIYFYDFVRFKKINEG
jgi:hypothetical protein